MSSPKRTKILGFFVAMCSPPPSLWVSPPTPQAAGGRRERHSAKLGRRLTATGGAGSLDHATAVQVGHDCFGGLLGRGGGGVDSQVGILRRLVGGVDAGEVLQVAAPRLLVEAFWIAPLGHVERRVDEDLDELPLAQQRPRHLSLRTKGRDERRA